ncbi:MAG: hypoxanthine phosphoribosyltransferase [Ruminococcus sp.]|nr:hypoxanthine phosphoribosyltransferase [Ruminococcus sp.]
MTITDKSQFTGKIKRVIITEEEICTAVKRAGEMLSREYEDKPLLLVSILKGAFIFLSDLTKEISIPCEVGFMAAKSYFADTASSGSVTITYDLAQDISNYHVVIVEDIIDTGRTLSEVVKMLESRGPLSLKVMTLLDKPDRRVVDFKADWSLFTIPDYFVIGYGLDFGEYYRNLPYIAEYDSQTDR